MTTPITVPDFSGMTHEERYDWLSTHGHNVWVWRNDTNGLWEYARAVRMNAEEDARPTSPSAAWVAAGEDDYDPETPAPGYEFVTVTVTKADGTVVGSMVAEVPEGSSYGDALWSAWEDQR